MANRIMVLMIIFSILMHENINAMHEKFLQCIQRGTGALFIGSGLGTAYGLHKKKQQPVEGDPMPENVQLFVRAVARQTGIKEADSISLLQVNDTDCWAIHSGKALVCSREEALLLQTTLEVRKKSLDVQREIENLVHSSSFFEQIVFFVMPNKLRELQEANEQVEKLIDECDRRMALITYVVKHECGHLEHKDQQRVIYALACIPLIIQSACVVATSAMKYVCRIQGPRGWLSASIRALFAIGAMPVKYILGEKIGFPLFCQYQEHKADRFACEHAATPLELEEAGKFHVSCAMPVMMKMMQRYPEFIYGNSFRQDLSWRIFFWTEYDDMHPDSLSRAHMTEQYRQAMIRKNEKAA